MIDSSIAPDPSDSDTMASNVELPVSVDTLTIDGTAPAVGDMVDLKVSGAVTRVVNTMAYVKPETVNDQPMPAPALEPNPAVDEGSRLERLSKTAGALSQGY